MDNQLNNQNNQHSALGGTLFTPAVSSPKLSFGVSRVVKRETELAAGRTVVAQVRVEGKALVARTAMLGVAELSNTAMTIASMYPESAPYLNHLLGEFVFSAANDIRNV